MRLSWLLLLAIIARPSLAQSTAVCDRGGVMSPAGVGPLRVGMPIDSVARVCRLISREFVSENAMTLHRVRVGADTVRVWEQGGRVNSIGIESPIHRTTDSLGVGSSVEQVLAIPGIIGEHVDGGYVLYTRSGAHCGLTFHLDPKTSQMMASVKGDDLRMLAMRGAGTVYGIDILGECTPGKQR